MGRLVLITWLAALLAGPVFAGDGAARKDSVGDPLPAGALARLGTNRLRHGGPVQALALSRDGRLLATAGAMVPVRVFEASSGQLLHELRGAFVPTALLFASDNKTLLTAEPAGTIRVWNLATGAELRRFGGVDEKAPAAIRMGGVPGGRITCMIFSHDERTLWFADGETIYQWLPNAGLDLREIPLGAGRILALSASPDGKELNAATSDGTVRVWDIEKNQEKRRFTIPVMNPRFGAANQTITTFSPDGRYLALSGLSTALQIYDVQTGEPSTSVAGRGRPVAIAFAPNSKSFAAAGPGQGVAIWGLASGRQLRQFDVGVDSLPRAHLTFSANGKVLAFATPDRAVRVWDVASSTELSVGSGHEAAISSLAFAADSATLLSAAVDRTIRVWDVPSGKELGALGRPETKQVGVPARFDVQSVVADAKGGGFFAAGAGWLYRIGWDGKKLQEERIGDSVRGYSGMAVGGPRQPWCIVRSPKSVEIVDARTGGVVSTLGKLGDPVTRAGAFAFSPDGELLATGGSGTPVQLWRVRTGRLIRTMTEVQRVADFTHLVFSGDGRMLLGSGGSFHLWEVASGQERFQFSVNQPRSQRALTFGPGSRAIVMGGINGTIFLLDATSGQLINEWPGHRGMVNCLELSPDGKKLASGSSDSTILIWDATSLSQRPRSPSPTLHTDEIEVLWKVLAEGDGVRAYRAIVALASSPAQSVPFIAKRISLGDAVDITGIAKWVADLDHPQLLPRQRAMKELERIGELAEDALVKALSGNPSLEMRARLLKLLERGTTPSPEKLRALRALEVLESSRTAAAREVIDTLARGSRDHWLADIARQSLERLDRLGVQKE